MVYWLRLRAAELLCAALLIAPAAAQNAGPASPPDPRIAAALQQISGEQIRARIEKLVSFGTRLTLSAQDPAAIASGRGIGAGALEAQEGERVEHVREGGERGIGHRTHEIGVGGRAPRRRIHDGRQRRERGEQYRGEEAERDRVAAQELHG